MSAYVIVQIELHEQTAYQRYTQLAPPSIGRYGGRYLTRGGAVEVLEGDWNPRRLVILEFPDMEAVRRWHASPEYAEAKALRQTCATAQILLAEALPVPFVPEWKG